MSIEEGILEKEDHADRADKYPYTKFIAILHTLKQS
jgi:hypothetical protein